ncbi:hypothetical protein [Hymenobacter negativus]|uniref:Lipoprotein n=1 Tax=Hymenobacter negativus TaxID=2795026 RepID=A0ABS3QG82_9BACT|nr:hypothetical protein [Hymenobacter negativus]MBO2010265.1 hypothetical protein [Hymenobacter negativus]
MIKPHLLLSLALLSACADDARQEKTASAPPDPKAVARRSLNDFLAASGPPVQVFQVPADRAARVRGAAGTSVWVPANAFATATGKPVTGPVEVELREYYDLADALVHGLATQAGPRLLATGGMVHLAARTGSGQPCQLRPGVALAVLFPAFRPEPGMRLFAGQELAGRGPVQWQPLPPVRATTVPPLVLAQPRFDFIYVEGMEPGAVSAVAPLRGAPEAYRWRTACLSDLEAGSEGATYAAVPRRQGPRATQADSLAEVSGYLFATTQLSWINCDRFLDRPAATLLDYAVSTDSEPVEISLVFKDFRGLLHGEAHGRQVVFANVPTNEPATLVAVRWVKGQIELATRPVKLSARPEPALVFHPVTRAELLAEFHQLDPQHRWEPPVSMPNLRYPCGGI